jgi:hypothetical protein
MASTAPTHTLDPNIGFISVPDARFQAMPASNLSCSRETWQAAGNIMNIA